MNVVFRADASLEIGTGHVMRCLTLANALRETGASCTFVCRAHEGHLGEHIRACGHALHLLPRVADFSPDDKTDPYARWLGSTPEQDAEQTQAVLTSDCDWLVVDHYGLDACWETRLRARARHLLAIDDLANRRHDCELLLDQNLGRDARDYDGLVGDRTQRLIGPRYALLRPEFAQWREISLARRRQPRLQQLLITMGGVDRDNA
ncbi:MAG: UDP-2,4-diacetamido-2,4,6-trideoxy-beta-L-altropyranose hydrolase, partial [Sinobacteraceae bacterium]|nr:UDP-2,4-diacetamido-2,4,6-trideoxy-beta-L-altropyranose hydrolase [Nevskiaceae bacterium]